MATCGPVTVVDGTALAVTKSSRWPTLPGALLVVAAGLAAYGNSFNGPCIFDDLRSITDNRSIRHLWPIGPVLAPPIGSTVSGRPLVNLTLAVNYALGGLHVRGYHLVNVVVHLLAALALMGVVGRTLRSPRLRNRFGPVALPLAAIVALLWAVHPLQTESVSYLVQRCESLAGLFYLLTLYTVIRGADATGGASRLWYMMAIIFCLLGVGCKEVIVTAPLVVLLYDRTFLSGSFHRAWRRRWGLYGALASSWLLVLFLLIHSAGRGGSIGLGGKITPWQYLLTQTWAITHYLKLTFWPWPLVLDYGAWVAPSVGAIWPAAMLVALLLALTVMAVWRRPMVGFVGVWFFACLAPTSSFVPVATQTMAEHRMYLALAAPICLAMVGGWTLCCRWRGSPAGALFIVAIIACALALTTIRRNGEYRSPLVMWQDTIHNWPDNPRAHNNLGLALVGNGQIDDGMAQYRQALRIQPDYPEACNNLGLALWNARQVDQAIAWYEKAVQIQPDYAAIHYNLGLLLVSRGHPDQALVHFLKVLVLQPDSAGAQINVGLVLAGRGRLKDAIFHFQRAVQDQPDWADAHIDLGSALAQEGRMAEAVVQFQQALAIEPDNQGARRNLEAARARLR